jgi:coniferyl-aldehyde dehydrogenase
MNKQFNHLKSQYHQLPYPTLLERRHVLKSLHELVKTNAKEVAEAIDSDFTKRSQHETFLLEVFQTLEAIRYVSKNLSCWMKPKKRRMGLWFMGVKAYLRPQPKGIIGIVVPWNYPLCLSMIACANAISAGNRVMIKFSEKSQVLAKLMKRLVMRYKLQDYIAIIDGDIDVARAFCELPFDHLMFTGSTEVGKSVMKAASDNLTPVTLELGGKSPVILSRTLNLKYLDRLIMGKCFNSGQTCIAPDHIYMPRHLKETFIERVKAIVKKHYPTDNHYTGLVDTKAVSRFQSLLQDAKAKGAELVSLADNQAYALYFPILVFNATASMKVMQEELFCPILPVMTYESLDDVIKTISVQPSPLALYYFGSCAKEIDKILNHTKSGSLTINDTLIQAGAESLPFGGIGHSGMGAYHGLEGFNTFSHLRPVVKQSRFSGFSLLYPPYGQCYRLLMKWVAGIKRGIS